MQPCTDAILRPQRDSVIRVMGFVKTIIIDGARSGPYCNGHPRWHVDADNLPDAPNLNRAI